MKHARWLMLIAAAVSIGLLLSLAFREAEPAPGIAPQLPKRHIQSAPLSHPPVQLAGLAASRGSAAAFEQMRARFDSATGYAAFIQDAMQRPDEGGRFYALLAYQRCREFAALSAAPVLRGAPEAVAAARTIVAGLAQRCHGVMEQFPNEQLLTGALLHSNARRPDALLIERGTLRPATREASESDIARALATRDPYLIAATMNANLDFIADQLGPEFRNGQEQALLYQAMAAASCEIARDCKGNYQLALFCAAGEPCLHTDFAAYIRQGVPAESLQLYDRTLTRILQLAHPFP